MTFAETLNVEACSAGLSEGRTWFNDSNGNEPKTVGEHSLLRNNNGVKVEHDGYGWVVQAEKDGKVVAARFNSDCYWEDLD